MLKVLELHKVVKESIEIDQYIPLKIRWGLWTHLNEEIIFWRTGNLNTSMLEIGISSKSGIISSLTVICADRIFLNNKDTVLFKNKLKEYGTPIFNIHSWPKSKTIDDPGFFEIQYYNNEVNLCISTNKVVKNIISGRVCFGLDSDFNLCFIKITQLSDKENYQIKDTLRYMKNQS